MTILFRRARAERRIIVTDDRDFGLLAERAVDRPPAIVLIRLDPLANGTRKARGKGHRAAGRRHQR